MNELKRIAENIESVFADSGYPGELLAAYDQMECLASHSGRETFLVRGKEDGRMAVAKCYDRGAFPFQPDPALLRDLSGTPGFPRLLGQYQNERMLCIVREYIEGEPLSDYARENPLSPAQIITFGCQLCDILSALHSHTPPIIHRDIKPENVIVQPDGSLSLIDFDIACAFKADIEGDSVFFGTRGYAPPEQYGFGPTDRRTDIYAFGVLLRWLMTGSARENKNVRIDSRVQAVIDRCTAFSPAARYDDIRQVKAALQRARQKRLISSPRRMAALAAALLLALCAGFAAGRYTDWLRPAARIQFAEPVIERAVRLQLGRESGALTPEDLSAVQRVYIYGSEAYADLQTLYSQRVEQHEEGPIHTLDDLKLLPHLEEVRIMRQGYVDVSALAELPRVHTLELKHMRVSGIQPIARLSRLNYAVLFDCGLNDVTPLEDCPWLETLDVGRNNLTDLKHLGSHPNVRSLGMMWLQMDSLNGIAERFPRLVAVTLQHSEIPDVSALREAPGLETVYVLPSQAEAMRAALDGTQIMIQTTEN